MKKYFLILAAVICSACSNLSNSKKVSKQELEFCENFFIALQVASKATISTLPRDMYNSMYNNFVNKTCEVLAAVRAKGVTDIKNAYTIPYNQRLGTFGDDRHAEEQKILKTLGINDDAGGTYGSIVHLLWDENAKWGMPELKVTFVEKLSNETKIWIIRDYLSMQQVRLLVKENGKMNIDNLESFSN